MTRVAPANNILVIQSVIVDIFDSLDIAVSAIDHLMTSTGNIHVNLFPTPTVIREPAVIQKSENIVIGILFVLIGIVIVVAVVHIIIFVIGVTKFKTRSFVFKHVKVIRLVWRCIGNAIGMARGCGCADPVQI